MCSNGWVKFWQNAQQKELCYQELAEFTVRRIYSRVPAYYFQYSALSSVEKLWPETDYFISLAVITWFCHTAAWNWIHYALYFVQLFCDGQIWVAKINSAVFMRKNKMFWTKECSIQLGYWTIHILHATSSRHALIPASGREKQIWCCKMYAVERRSMVTKTAADVASMQVMYTKHSFTRSVYSHRKESFTEGCFLCFTRWLCYQSSASPMHNSLPLSSSLCSFALLCLKIIAECAVRNE